MSAIYKFSLFLFLFLSFFGGACARTVEVAPVAASPVAKSKDDCAGAACLNDAAYRIATQSLCPEGRIAVANSLISSASLVVCDCQCTSHDNVGWVAWKDSVSGTLSVVSVFPGKLASAQDFFSTPSPLIYDIYAPVGMCRPVDYKELMQNEFVTLIKRPDEGGTMPYCFDALYMTVAGGSLVMHFDGHLVDVNDSIYFGAKVSARDVINLQRILDAHKK